MKALWIFVLVIYIAHICFSIAENNFGATCGWFAAAVTACILYMKDDGVFGSKVKL